MPYLLAPIFATFRPEIVIPLAAFMVPITIVIAVMYFGNQRRRMWHETARIALEKGQPIPLAGLDDDDKPDAGPRPSSARRDVKAGLILIAVAAGIYFGSRDFAPLKHASMGVYIPGFIGVALLINAAITAFLARKAKAASAPNA